jgi:thiol-disulfide isomerase/thioredoxin
MTFKKMTKPNIWIGIGRRKTILNIALALCSIGIIIFNRFCSGICSYISGDLFGLDLRYLGLAFMTVIMVLSLVKNDLLLTMALSTGMGIEIYLVSFQIWFNTFCPYCLAFGGVLMLLFLLNIRKANIKEALLYALAGLVLFALFFNGSVTPAFADEPLVPTFGKGKTQVRLYTDYFCPPCRELEPEIEPILKDLVKKNTITLIFIDTPLSKDTPLYARYFLYIMNEKKTLEKAFLARSILFEAAIRNLSEPLKLEEVLKNNEIKFKPFEVKPTLEILNSYIRGDRTRSTPTCVIVQDGKTNQYTGKSYIISALERLKS